MSESLLVAKWPCPSDDIDIWPNATLALETPSQGGSPRTGISQATREYMDARRASIEDLVWGGTGMKTGETSSGTRSIAVCDGAGM